LAVKPGDTVKGDIYIQNTGSERTKIKVYAEDWVYSLDGSKTFMKQGSSVYSCSNWISLEPASFEIGAKETKKVTYSLTAPNNASGGHVCVIFFESVAGVSQGIAVSGRIGTIVYQDTAGDVKRSGEIKEILVTSTDEVVPPTIKVTFLNKGNTHISARAKLKVLHDKDVVQEIQLKPMNSLPGDSQTSTVTLPKPLKEGKYKASVELLFDDKTLESQSDFTINNISQK
jgi:hypothetical protein